MRSDQLAAAQTGVQAVRILSAALLVLVLALYALAIYLARGARRQTIRNIGFAFVLVGLTCSSCAGSPATSRSRR